MDERNKPSGSPESPSGASRRFFVKAGSINEVRRALHRAPGGAHVIGRYDRETIECAHTMDEHSLHRHWAVILSRLGKEGLKLVDRPGRASPEKPGSHGT